MKPYIKHALLTLLGLSIGFVITFEAFAGPNITVPGNACQPRQGNAVLFKSSGAIESRQNSTVRVFCPLSRTSVSNIFDVDIHIDKRSDEGKTLRCSLRIRDSEGDFFDTFTQRVTKSGKRTIFNFNRDVPRDGFFFVDCNLQRKDQITFITVQDKS